MLAISGDDLTLTWVLPTAGSSATSSQNAELWWRNADGSGSWARIGGTVSISDASTLSNAWNNQSSGRQFRARYQAVNSVGSAPWSDWSNTVTYSASAVVSAPSAAPTGLSASGTTLSWSAVTGATSYDLFWYLVTSSSQPKVSSAADWTSNSNSSTNSKIVVGRSFWVRARNSAGAGPWSARFNYSADAPSWINPNAPTGFAVTPGDASAALLWTKATQGSGTITYDVSHKLATATSWTQVNVGDVDSHTVSSLVNGAAYDFRVRAVNQGSDGTWHSSAWAATVRVTPVAAVVVPSRPAAPDISTLAYNPRAAGFGISVSAVTGATQYRARYRNAVLSGARWIATAWGSNPSASVASGLTNGQDYDVAFQARSGPLAASTSAWSSSATIDIGVPDAPAITLPSVTATVIRTLVTAGANNGASTTKARLQRRAQGTTNWTTVSDRLQSGSTLVGNHTAGVTTAWGIVARTTYEFRGAFENSRGWSPWSAIVTAVTTGAANVPAKAAAPTLNFTNNDIVTAWAAPSNGGSAFTANRIEVARQDNFGAWPASAQLSSDDSTSPFAAAHTFANQRSGTYRARVRYTNGVGDAAWSDWSASATLVAGDGFHNPVRLGSGAGAQSIVEWFSGSGLQERYFSFVPARSGSARVVLATTPTVRDFDLFYMSGAGSVAVASESSNGAETIDFSVVSRRTYVLKVKRNIGVGMPVSLGLTLTLP